MNCHDGHSASGDVATPIHAEATGSAVSSKMPTVWIVVPAYNRATLLPHALDSILAQTFTRWTLVVVDDHSTDETWSGTRLPPRAYHLSRHCDDVGLLCHA